MPYYRVFGAKRRHAKTRQMVTFSCFRMATFRPATQKYDTFNTMTKKFNAKVQLLLSINDFTGIFAFNYMTCEQQAYK